MEFSDWGAVANATASSRVASSSDTDADLHDQGLGNEDRELARSIVRRFGGGYVGGR